MLLPERVPSARDAPAVAPALGVLLLSTSIAAAAPAETAPAAASVRDAAAQAAVATDEHRGADAPPSAATSLRRPVFVCEDAGIPVFSDRPCGAAITPPTVSFAAPPAGAAASTLPPVPRASTKPRPQPVAARGPGDPAASRCDSLRRQIEELDDHMRTGYSSREAARLWNRWRDLKSRLRSSRC